jgi:hypothetical protein
MVWLLMLGPFLIAGGLYFIGRSLYERAVHASPDHHYVTAISWGVAAITVGSAIVWLLWKVLPLHP